ncbi:MAG: alpha/beta fold hydrolase [Nitriliruptorales bacterium]|nr:alpha/beta fold hydrolase [Nitriliruptorales bacterium]
MQPARQGYVEHDGVKIGYEVFGDGAPTLLLMPTWTIVHSRFWKLQVPYLARHHRVVTFDGPGNGRSDRPVDPDAYSHDKVVAGAVAVLEATGTEAAVGVGLSKGALWLAELAASFPELVLGAVFIGGALPLTPPRPERASIAQTFLEPYPENPEGWEKYNAAYWRDHWEEFAEFFFSECFNEPHSTKQREDAVGWALETTPEVVIAEAAADYPTGDEYEEMLRRMECPVLAIHGTEDRIIPPSRSDRLVELAGGELVLLEGAGHIPLARDPVRVNVLLRDFVDRVTHFRPQNFNWTRGRSRAKRALWISSPIGLGHVRRDLATAQALREHHPDLQIDWLAQHPVTRVLEEAGETVHPASEHLASESAHIESESAEHDLHCFQAWRRMDEILLADFMVFDDVVTDRHYDLVVGDEAWDVDYYLHENPELKRFAYAWSTDFVGWLPMPSGGDRERFLTADYNAEMIEHIARYPRVRDAALFVGNPEDIVDERFGPDLPLIRDWTEQHYTFPGYVTGFDPRALGDREELRAELGYHPDEQVCIVTVGGSGVGTDLLRTVIDAFPHAKRQVPALRMIVVAGPRIDPDALPQHDGLEVRGYVHELYRHLSVCDLAVVQGGLTTCMELTASQRPFVYIPLRNHFEQNPHVHHRLRRHRAGRRLDYEDATPDHLASVIAAEIGRDVDYRPVETDGAARAAATLAELL